MPRAQSPSREKAPEILELVAHRAVDDVRAFWKSHQRYPTVLLAWPLDPEIPHDVVHLTVPDNITSFHAAAALATKTSAYALFLLEQQEDKLLLLLETRTGTFAISLPIERHGDTKVLGTPRESRNTESIGVLWRKGDLPS